MAKMNIWGAAVLGLVLGAAGAFGQQRTVQASPAYYQNSGAVYHQQPAGVPAQPRPAAPAPRPAYRAPQPVYQAPAQETYVYEDDEEEYEEDGIYWFWGQKWPGLALGPKFGTTGLGADLTFGINPYLNLRAGYNYAKTSFNTKLGDVDYDMDVDVGNLPLLVDIQPFGGHFRITGGCYIMTGDGADLSSTPTSDVQIGSHTYGPDVVGTLSGKIEIADALAPYLGIGFGNAVGEDQLLTFTLDLGVIFQSYDVSLTSNGAGMTTLKDTFRQDLAKEESNLQDDMDSYKIYPVLTLGVSFHF